MRIYSSVIYHIDFVLQNGNCLWESQFQVMSRCSENESNCLGSQIRKGIEHGSKFNRTKIQALFKHIFKSLSKSGVIFIYTCIYKYPHTYLTTAHCNRFMKNKTTYA